mmetsp:Transcript_132351/g.330026  ORF Transcript_132351/g.330026 Transcript_132351/m.330026 type:complete len:307 (-) Transcript_132351:228-1148(-)
MAMAAGFAFPAYPEPSMGKGAISQLQEFVQASKRYPLPPSCPILQWACDTRSAGGTLDFRATVAFLLDGVPQHVTGGWQASKKLAQRDAAESALVFFISRWGLLGKADLCSPHEIGEILQERGYGGSSSNIDVASQWCGHQDCRESAHDDALNHAFSLALICVEMARCVQMEGLPPHGVPSTLRYETCDAGDGLQQAFVHFDILGVPHTFPGKACGTYEGALVDAMKRVLWYVQWPGFENSFEPDPEKVRAAASQIPSPPAVWTKDDGMFAQAATSATLAAEDMAAITARTSRRGHSQHRHGMHRR